MKRAREQAHQALAHFPTHATQIIPRIALKPITLTTFGVYGVLAYLVRSGKWQEWEPAIGNDYEGVDNSVFAGATFLVPFMIVFYVGYCYNRYYALYFACMKW